MAGQAIKAGTGRLHVLDVCPQLILQDRTKRFYDGYITVCVSKGKTVWLSNAYWYFTIAFIILPAILQKRSFRISIEIPENNSLKDARWVYPVNLLRLKFSASVDVFGAVFLRFTVRNTHGVSFCMLVLLHANRKRGDGEGWFFLRNLSCHHL